MNPESLNRVTSLPTNEGFKETQYRLERASCCNRNGSQDFTVRHKSRTTCLLFTGSGVLDFWDQWLRKIYCSQMLSSQERLTNRNSDIGVDNFSGVKVVVENHVVAVANNVVVLGTAILLIFGLNLG